MKAVLLTGRAGSASIAHKNVYPVLGRPLGFYPMWAALQAREVDRCFLTTDSEPLADLASSLGIAVIERPSSLAGSTAELIDAIRHALPLMGSPDTLITMHCNVAYHRPGVVDECISLLEAEPDSDSCVTGYVDRGVHPIRTRRIDGSGRLRPWLQTPPEASSNRQALDACFILDGAARAIRLADGLPTDGSPPFAYLGNRVIPVVNGRGGDIHGLEDVAMAEWMLRQNGWEMGISGNPGSGAPMQ
jgi:N-acylneuraminate cytidylyltransferase